MAAVYAPGGFHGFRRRLPTKNSPCIPDSGHESAPVPGLGPHVPHDPCRDILDAPAIEIPAGCFLQAENTCRYPEPGCRVNPGRGRSAAPDKGKRDRVIIYLVNPARHSVPVRPYRDIGLHRPAPFRILQTGANAFLQELLHAGVCSGPDRGYFSPDCIRIRAVPEMIGQLFAYGKPEGFFCRFILFKKKPYRAPVGFHEI